MSLALAGAAPTQPLAAAMEMHSWPRWHFAPLPLHPVVFGKRHFLLRGTEAKEKHLFGDLGSCFRTKMVLGPTESQALHPPTPTEHGATGWEGPREPFVISRILSPSLHPLSPLFSCIFNQGEGGEDTCPQHSTASPERGRVISPSARAGRPRGSQTTGTCVAPVPLPLPRTPPSGFSMFSQGGLTPHGQEELPGPLPHLLTHRSPPRLSTQQTSLPKAASSSLPGTVPGKKSPHSLSSPPGLNFPAAISSFLFNPTQPWDSESNSLRKHRL